MTKMRNFDFENGSTDLLASHTPLLASLQIFQTFDLSKHSLLSTVFGVTSLSLVKIISSGEDFFAVLTMECLHGKPASCSITNRGTFWFCGQKPSCEFFCRDEDCYIFTKAVEDFRKSGPQRPVCPTHKKLAKLRTVEDKMKQTTAVHSSYALNKKILAHFGNEEMYIKI